MFINFAHKTFRWDSEASLKAHVHCVIVGFSGNKSLKNIIYDNGRIIISDNINQYLVNANNVFIKN